MQIRNWTEKDLPEVNRLLGELSECLGMVYHGNLELLRRHFLLSQASPGQYCTFVASADDAIVGLISLVYYSSVLHRKGTALVTELVVSQSFRGKGIGTRLLQRCIDLAQANGYDEIEVGVERGNAGAIDFYKRNGIEKEYVLLGREFDRDTRLL